MGVANYPNSIIHVPQIAAGLPCLSARIKDDSSRAVHLFDQADQLDGS